MTKILHRQIHGRMPYAAKGDGLKIIDTDGKAYLDACGGAAVSCLGHSHPAVIEAMRAQIEQISYAHTAFFTTAAAEELASELTRHAPQGLDYVYLVSGGSEAMEASLKMARQHYIEVGEPQRRHVIARSHSYHGNTLGVLAVGGNQMRRAQFEPLLIETHHIDPCYAYRYQRQDESDADYAARSAQQLEEKINELGSDQVLAFVAETVVGATTGSTPPVGDYFKRIREICDRHGVLLILDEVMCGMGRTGTLYACEQEGISPDILAIAKGLGGGYQPIGAVLLSEKIYSSFKQGSGFFQHGHTYMGHPLASAAALAVHKEIATEKMMSNVRAMGEYLNRSLQDMLGDHPNVGDIRGRGLFRSVELVSDRQTKVAFDPALAIHSRVKREAMKRGLMIYPMKGCVDGKSGDHILLAPPFIVRENDIDEMVGRLGEAVRVAVSA